MTNYKWVPYMHLSLFLILSAISGAVFPWSSFFMLTYSIMLYDREQRIYDSYHWLNQSHSCLKKWIGFSFLLHALSYIEIILSYEYQCTIVLCCFMLLFMVFELMVGHKVFQRKIHPEKPNRPWSKHSSIQSPKQDECMICLEEFAPGDHVVKATNCFHQFHDKCLGQWYDSADVPSCPTCRSDLRTSAVQIVADNHLDVSSDHTTKKCILCLTLVLLVSSMSWIEIDHANQIHNTMDSIQDASFLNGTVPNQTLSVFHLSGGINSLTFNGIRFKALFGRVWTYQCHAMRSEKSEIYVWLKVNDHQILPEMKSKMVDENNDILNVSTDYAQDVHWNIMQQKHFDVAFQMCSKTTKGKKHKDLQLYKPTNGITIIGYYEEDGIIMRPQHAICIKKNANCTFLFDGHVSLEHMIQTNTNALSNMLNKVRIRVMAVYSLIITVGHFLVCKARQDTFRILRMSGLWSAVSIFVYRSVISVEENGTLILSFSFYCLIHYMLEVWQYATNKIWVAFELCSYIFLLVAMIFSVVYPL